MFACDDDADDDEQVDHKYDVDNDKMEDVAADTLASMCHHRSSNDQQPACAVRATGIDWHIDQDIPPMPTSSTFITPSPTRRFLHNMSTLDIFSILWGGSLFNTYSSTD